MKRVSELLMLGVLFSLYFAQTAWAAREDKPTIEERLIRLEAKVDEGFKAVNQRFEDMNRSIDRRFDDMNRRFDDMRFWLQFIFGVQVLIIGGLVAQWLMMWKRIIAVEKVVETHLKEKEEKELIALQRKEIEILKATIDDFRKRLEFKEAVTV